MRSAFIATAAVVLLTGCGQPSDAAKTAELAAPAAPPAVPVDASFTGFTKPKGDRTKTYGPVMLEFVDITSPARKNALGNVTYSVKLKVLPDAYAVTDDRVRLVGKHPKLGDVRMDVKIDPSALKKSKTTKGKDGVTVAAGALQVGDTPFKDVAFTWRGGDWG